jgi:RimJ/RimL family protein N-acetyltransferase
MKKINLNLIEHRQPNSSDALEHFRAVQESHKEIVEYLPDFIGMNKWTIDRHEQYLIRLNGSTSGMRNYFFFYEGQLVGAGHLKPAAWNYSGELLYWVRTGWDGLGIGMHIADIMTKHAYKHFGYRFVVIETDKENLGSRRIAEKSGFRLALIYGYVDHLNRNGNMAVWVKEAPMTKMASRFDSSYQFDPISLLMPLRYRSATDQIISAYMKPESSGGSPRG